jgi:ArsR family transcriptional regulator
LFLAVADPARVKIVNLLATGGEPLCACEFEQALGLSQPTVSHHLKKLTEVGLLERDEVGLLEREQRGTRAYFSLNGEAMERLASLVQIPEVVR